MVPERKRVPGKTAVKRTAGTKTGTTSTGYGPRDDFGKPAAQYFARQPADKRALLEKLHAIVMKGVPGAEVSIKWGVPVYGTGGKSVCALAGFKEHVGLNLFAPPEVLVDPGKKLEGGGKASRMLKVRSAGDIDAPSILRWLEAAAAARG